MAKIGYARVSSYEQNLDRQIQKLEAREVDKIYTDKLSGKNKQRPGLKLMLDYIRDGDVVIVTELDRLGRNNKELSQMIYEIQKKGATLECLNLPTMTGIEDENLRRLINTLVLEIYIYQAENERKNIKMRQKEGILIAKAKGVYKGRKPLFPTENDQRLQHGFQLYKEGRTLSEVERLTGINKETFRRYVKKYKIKREKC